MKFTRYIPILFGLAGLALFAVATTQSGCLIVVGSAFSGDGMSLTCGFLTGCLAFLLIVIGLIWWVSAQILRKRSAKRIGGN